MEKNIKYITLSKYLIKHFYQYPKLSEIEYSIKIHYKQKQKYFLFINITLLLLFFNCNIKTLYIYKNILFNILKIKIRNQYSIIAFLLQFICVYFPLIDSFSAELVSYQNKNYINFIFLKLPIFFELNSLFVSFEYLYNFVNNYKSELKLKTNNMQKNLTHLNSLHILKLPVILNT